MDRVINFELIRNPVNWIIVFLMVTFAAMAAFHFRPAFS